MRKLHDYSGKFKADLEPADFTRELLIDIVKLYSRLYMGLDGIWYLSIKEKASNDDAVACDILTWKRASKYEMSRITKRFNIQGNDVIALMKALQLTPWYWTVKARIEIESPDRAVLTVSHCPTVDALEKEGEGRENQICQMVEPEIYNAYCSYFSPDMKAILLKAPPRKSKDDIYCQWEFKRD